MKKTAYCFVVFLLLLQGCGGKENVPVMAENLPADSILGRDRMIDLLTDVQIAEGAMLLNRNRGTERKSDVAYYYSAIFHKYRISRSCYLGNVKHYQKDPADFVKMYDAVIKKIAERGKNYDPKIWLKLGVNRDGSE